MMAPQVQEALNANDHLLQHLLTRQNTMNEELENDRLERKQVTSPGNPIQVLRISQKYMHAGQVIS
jgi:hypothetical protein